MEKNGTILIVGDMEVSHPVTENPLKDSYSIEHAADGKDAYDAIFVRGIKPDLVLSDIDNLEDMVNIKAAKHIAQKDRMIESLSTVIEYRHLESAMHIKRYAAFARLIIERALSHPKFKHDLIDMDYELMIKAAPLHDVGKIAVPDAILLKPGKLTALEREIVKTHTTVGGKIIETIMEFEEEDKYFTHCYDIAMYHHEWWNGKGYPDKLSGTGIPLSARIMAIIDVYDALITKRVYKDACSHDEAVAILKEGAGVQFDPNLIDIIVEIQGEINDIAEKLKDPD